MKPKSIQHLTTLVHPAAQEKISEDFGLARPFLVHWHEPAVQPAVQNHHAPRMFHCQDWAKHLGVLLLHHISHSSTDHQTSSHHCGRSVPCHTDPAHPAKQLPCRTFDLHWASLTGHLRPSRVLRQRNNEILHHHLAASLGLINRYGQELHIVFFGIDSWYTCMIH